jgi:alginate O-acetyltransferase complex protein AlgI
VYSAPVVFYHLWGLAGLKFQGAVGSVLRDALYALLLVLILTNSGSPGAFIYFQF